MPKRHAYRKTAHNVKMLAKAGKSKQTPTEVHPGKAPQRRIRQAGGMRASLNRGAKGRVTG